MGLDDDPFDWQLTKDGSVRIFRGGRLVTTVRGASAHRLAAKLDRAGVAAVHQLLARATGNYRRGNERS